MVVKKHLIRTKEDLQRQVEKFGENSYIYCIARDSNNKVITAYLYTIELEGKAFMPEDVIGEVRVWKNREVGKALSMLKIGKLYYDFDCFPVFRDWIEFPIKDVYLYSKETPNLVNHCKMLGIYKKMDF